MNTHQRAAIGTATTAAITHATQQGLQVTGIRIGEHADGSGRWHVLLDAVTTATAHDVTTRTLVNVDGTIDTIEILEAARW